METRGVTAALLCSSPIMSPIKIPLRFVRSWHESTSWQESQQQGTGVRPGLHPTSAGCLQQEGLCGPFGALGEL